MTRLFTDPAKKLTGKMQAGKTGKHITRKNLSSGAAEPVNIFGPAEKIFKGWEFFEDDFYKEILFKKQV